MASQSIAANPWSNIFRTGDTGVAWTGIATAVQSADASYIYHQPYSNLVGGGDPTHSRPVLSPTVRCTFSAFSLPAGDTVTSAILTIRARQHSWPSYDGSFVVIVDAGGTTVNQTLSNVFVNYMISLAMLPTVAALNAGGFTVDIHCAGSGVAIPLFVPIDDPTPVIPDIDIDRVLLTVNTITPGSGAYAYVPRKTGIIGSTSIKAV